MRAQSRRLWKLAAATVLAILARSVPAAPPPIDETIEPSQIQMGESARLTILSSGSGALSVTLPVVPGLEFRVVGQSHRVEIINGAAIESTSTIVRVTPQETGVFSIPGVTPKSSPLVLRVDPAGGTASAPAPNAGLPGFRSILPGKADANGIRLTPDGSAFVRLELPKREAYVGESIPVQIHVGMRDGFVASINGLPKLNSNDFTLNNLSRQPERAAKTVDGKAFTVLTWRSVLAAVKPGTYSLSFETPLTVRIRTRPRQDSMIDDLLGDPFLQNVFGMTVPKNIDVTSPPTPFTVLPLPAQGRPPDFSGAVGNFKISADISSSKNTAGDPLTLRMHVLGTGNFDRVESSMLGADSQWKTYEPKSVFNPSDTTGYRGEKIFEQPLVATKPGAHAVPPLAFSFFDPATRRYETARSAPLSVMVSPSAAENTQLEPSPSAAAAASPVDRSHGGLRPDHPVSAARAASSLMPLYFQPRFLAIPSTLALLFAGSWVALLLRERRAIDMRAGNERAAAQLIRAQLERMTAAAAAGDASGFFIAARSALQYGLGARWQVPPDQINPADVDEETRAVFALADEASYAGRPPRTGDLERWSQLVHRQLGVEDPS